MEIEAKFQLSKAEDWEFWQERFCRPQDLVGWQPDPHDRTDSLAAFYYDTPEASLHQAGFSLRLRLEGRRLVLTIKRHLRSQDPEQKAPKFDREGIVTREEWEEVLLESGSLDFKPQDYEDLAWDRVRILTSQDQALAPVWEILAAGQVVLLAASRFTRQKGNLWRGGTQVEWALDKGYFQHPGLEDEAFAELELELKAGNRQNLEDLISDLQTLRPLGPQAWSKQVRALHAPYDLIILGAGPAGLAAGIGAGLKAEAEKLQARILILDKEKEAGRKILASGNGRCNLSNQAPKSDQYLSQDPGQLKPFIEQIPRKFTHHFCREIGLAWTSDEAGRIYPQAEEARAVRDLLLARLESLQVHLQTATEICQIYPPEYEGQTYYLLDQAGQIFRAKSLILALGSPASPALGGNWSMTALAKVWELPCQTFRPGLCGLLLDPQTQLSQVLGTRVKATATLASGVTSQGEFLFNKGALSGIAAMDLANVLGGEKGSFAQAEPQADPQADSQVDPQGEWIFDQALTLSLDFFPHWQAGDLAKALADKGRSYGWKLSWRLLLASYLPTRLSQAILADLGVKLDAQAEPKLARSLAYKLKAYPLKLRGLKSFADAQVARGGLDLSAIRQDYSLKAYPGAYVCGEALDVVGFCGGYNLHFALASGYRAGQAAITDLSGLVKRRSLT